MSEQNRNYEQIEEITLHFGKGTVEPFTAKASGQRFLPMGTQPSPSRIWPVRVKTARISGRKQLSATVS